MDAQERPFPEQAFAAVDGNALDAPPFCGWSLRVSQRIAAEVFGREATDGRWMDRKDAGEEVSKSQAVKRP